MPFQLAARPDRAAKTEDNDSQPGPNQKAQTDAPTRPMVHDSERWLSRLGEIALARPGVEPAAEPFQTGASFARPDLSIQAERHLRPAAPVQLKSAAAGPSGGGGVIQLMREQEAKTLYRNYNLKSGPLREAARKRVTELKQAQSQDWRDYLHHNKLTEEGLPRGIQSLGMFGKRQEQKQQASTSGPGSKQEEERDQESSAQSAMASSAWASTFDSGSVALEEYLSEGSMARLKGAYGQAPFLDKLLGARSESDIQAISDSILNSDLRSAFKGDIGEVLSASAKQHAGWYSVTHQRSSTEHGLDVVSFAPPPNLHVRITEVKYWPSKMGEFTHKALPVSAQRAVEAKSAAPVKDELIGLLRSRDELASVREAYLAALRGDDDVPVSWEIEIIGDKSPKIAKDIRDAAESGLLGIHTFDSVTARLIEKTEGPKSAQPAPGPFGVLPGKKKTQPALAETSGASASLDDNPPTMAPVSSSTVQPPASQTSAPVQAPAPPPAPQVGQDMFTADFDTILAMPRTPVIQDILNALWPLVQAARAQGIDEPYWYYGRMRW